MHGDHTVTIRRPAAVVFEHLADGIAQQHVAPARGRGGAAQRRRGEGTVWRQVVRGPAGKAVDADYRVTRHEPPSAYGFEIIAGPCAARGCTRSRPSTTGNPGHAGVDAEAAWRHADAHRFRAASAGRRAGQPRPSPRGAQRAVCRVPVAPVSRSSAPSARCGCQRGRRRTRARSPPGAGRWSPGRLRQRGGTPALKAVDQECRMRFRWPRESPGSTPRWILTLPSSNQHLPWPSVPDPRRGAWPRGGMPSRAS